MQYGASMSACHWAHGSGGSSKFEDPNTVIQGDRVRHLLYRVRR